ncbi:MAG: aspartyl protease family protein [Acidobacteria bacterium]|nr:aspartyl protease family protein [Acidobacteriota bacterium]
MAGAASRAAGAAPSSLRGAPPQTRTPPPPLPAPVRFREVSGRGLLVKAWVNNSGPYDFAVDTGAGATILSRRVAAEARVPVSTDSPVSLSGLSGRRGAAAREATVRSFAVGGDGNSLPARGLFIVADSLPADLDGVLDPTECFHPLGYVIDFSTETLRAFDPRQAPLRRSEQPDGGAVVSWLTEQGSRRPFVMLDGGRRALIDTGSGFGLAVTEQSALALGIPATRGREREGVRDLGRGRVDARRIRPATVNVGPLALRGVPTDLLAGAAPNAPVLLGRDALRPFELTFDPVNRLIRFAPR